MNSIDALYAVTRMSWIECREDRVALFLFKKSGGFKFPILDTFKTDLLLTGIALPLHSGKSLPDNIYLYVFGSRVKKEEIPSEWHHYILATLNGLAGKKICECCNNVRFRQES